MIYNHKVTVDGHDRIIAIDYERGPGGTFVVAFDAECLRCRLFDWTLLGEAIEGAAQ